MAHVIAELDETNAAQQPEWEDAAVVRQVREILRSCPPLVTADDTADLRSCLARVAAREALVIQAGDCAEDPAEHTADHVRRKSAGLGLLADILSSATGKPVLCVGRIAGQFAKPRSSPFERVGDMILPAFRGHAVNSPAPDPVSRRPDPRRILTCYRAARSVLRELSRHAPVRGSWSGIQRTWTSHEALLLDYEVPLIRATDEGARWLASTHWPWVGDRTRRPDGAHVDLLAGVANPVACKVGPSMGTDEIVDLCDRLDPLREPGRLTLIARMGADFVATWLPPLVNAVRTSGHPVIWLCDPMHGNTITARNGTKTRLVATMLREVRDFRRAMAATGGVAGGLHLETTLDEVTECVADASEFGSTGYRRTTFCDPRLNTAQAVSMVSAWVHSR